MRRAKLACPVCSFPLERAVREGVEIDVCPDHGVWFEIGEFEDLFKRQRGRALRRRYLAVRRARAQAEERAERRAWLR